MDTTSNNDWAKQRCIFRNSSFSCWIFSFFSHSSDHILLLRICLLLFQKFQKSSTISSASETVFLKVLPWCWKPGFKWYSILRCHEQPTMGLRSFSHSTCSLCFTQGNNGEQFFGLSFWARFSCCNVLRRSAETPSVLLFCYHQITVRPVGSLQWGSDPWVLNVLVYLLLWSPGKVTLSPDYESSTCQQPDVSTGAFL